MVLAFSSPVTMWATYLEKEMKMRKSNEPMVVVEDIAE